MLKLMYLDSIMTAQIKVEFVRMCDTAVHCCTRRNIPCFANFISLVFTEQSRMMALLNHNKSDSRAIIFFKHNTGLLYSPHLVNKNLVKLTLADSVPVEDDLARLRVRVRSIKSSFTITAKSLTISCAPLPFLWFCARTRAQYLVA